MAKYRDLLKERDFIFYSAGQLISQFGDRLVQIILIGLIYKISPGSTMELAKALSFTLVPAFFVSPLAGVWVDRWNNKKTMIICDILRSSLVFTLPVFLATGQITPVYIAIFCIFTCACFFLPAKFAIIPDLVPKEKLLLANSLSTIVTVVGGVAGITIGGLILEIIDIKKTIYLNSFVYLVSAISLSFIVYKSKKGMKEKTGIVGEKIKEALKTSFLYELIEGLRYLVQERRVRFVIFVLFLVMSMVGAIYVVSVIFIQDIMGSITRDIGLFGFFLCLGLLLGSYFYGKKGHSMSKDSAIYASLLASGVFVGLFAVCLSATASFFLGSLIAFFAGMAAAPVMISANTIIHEDIDDSMRGRIFSSLGIVMNLGLLIFMLIASSLAEVVGKIWILLTCGVIFGGFGLAGLVLNRRGRPDR
ncbi:MAG: MFS transporter [Candidatus Omnitrophica bacterium]|nr:MFS transporter [Candidatus Omnitrophota bacterium]